MATAKKETKKLAASAAKAPAKKPAAKKAPAKKAPAKKPAAKKVAKAPVKKEQIFVELYGAQADITDIVARAKAHYKENGGKAVRNIAVYVKIEDNAAFYTVNGKGSNKNRISLL